ncbi:hypothetical protein QBC34DRAFT_391468 [Podospora aff. communis PSN243]|uniref:Uncharacterized protein n=1 Tax=Podospora aff. communis PSN243 TaxID=3040156 RepID=A0AAV9H554_9PEZI|nr:hypothetical protein QBC34DRAFT_391468 [Podospora aff. communis PSN243]
MSQVDKGKSKDSRAPPALFFPSPSPSQVSLPGITAPGISSPPGQPGGASGAVFGARSGSLLRGDPSGLTSPVRSPKGATGPPTLNLNLPLQLPRGESTRATDRTDALWSEMQATLEEVELSATGGTRVFGPDHERKLSELRSAQIALAQAWARSEADDAIETISSGNAKSPPPGTEGDGAGKSEAGGAAATDGAKSTAGTGSARPGSSGMGVGGAERLGAKLEEETAVDILLARKRREANDRYFQRVNQGVLDVVAKLEEVATAMRAVEQESKDVWAEGDDDSAPTSVPGSVPGSAKG